VVVRFRRRKGEMISMQPLEGSEGFTFLSFLCPTRGLIGLRSALMTLTKGTAITDTLFHKYLPKVAGSVTKRDKGSLLAYETGVATTYGIEGLILGLHGHHFRRKMIIGNGIL
jgi:GTP-binding protein